MSTALLKVENRTPISTRTNKRLRKTGVIPGSISIRGENSVSISLLADDFRKALSKYGRSAVFKLDFGNKKSVTAMIKDIQILPINNEIQNVVFVQVSLKEEIKAEVKLRVVNSEVLDLNKMIQTFHTETLTLIGLPSDIPNSIDVDGELLLEKGNLYVKDLILPKGVQTEADSELMVLSTSVLRMREEEPQETEKSDEDTQTETDEVK